MLRRPAALLSFSITARNLWSLLGFRFAPKLASCTTLQLSSSSTAGYRTRTRFRAMSTSVNSTPVNEKDEQVFQDFKLLNAVDDRYGGVIVEVREAMDSALFGSVLRASIAQWRHQGKKGVWIKLPIQHVNLVEAAVKEGFWFHHAEPNYLMLCYWIPEGTHTLPANASHRIGIGAFVMNEKREVLVVQESTGRFRGTGVWKFPTGVVNELRFEKSKKRQQLIPNLSKYWHSDKVTKHSSISRIYSSYACSNHFLQKFRSRKPR
ncbi:hypothetical protein ES332_D06G270300v1 [Gossypium tomentosum]|uniref:Pre-nudix hydrolase domain-containing protein n=1 Tax=Gossypium tomentosum TaxID=34277 RepID=A0A5D2KPF0_GOSTO|nr:hypothetical protein ES332_D06G270300v1 [Gossypium tomentosum]